MTSVAADAPKLIRRPPHSDSVGAGRRTPAPCAAAVAPLNNNTCGDRRATPVDRAAAAQQQDARRPP